MAGAPCTYRNCDRDLSRRSLKGNRELAAVLAAALSALAASTATGSGPATPEATRRIELIRLVRQDCGSCHGMTLKGGLGPALTPEALREKAPESLVATIVWGRSGTAMPPWRSFLSEVEAGWIVEQLQKGLGNAR